MLRLYPFKFSLLLLLWMTLPAQDTSLHMAIVDGNRASVNALIAGGADVNGQMPGGWTPLMVCIKYNKINMIQDLIKGRAKVNAVNDVGNTALIVAVTSRNIEAVKIMLANSADVLHKNKDGMNALDIANLMGANDILLLLNDYLNQKG